jgi:hypothetical protein
MKWKEFGKWYRINKLGQVESCSSGLWKPMKTKKSKTDKYGGYYLTVSIDGHKRLHLLMWEMFKGPRRKGFVINHKDGDRDNCALDNLEEITQKDNIKNIIERGKFKLFGKPYDRNTASIQRVQNIDQCSPGRYEELGA